MGFPRKEQCCGLALFLQGIFLTQGWNPCLLHCRRFLYHWATREAQMLPIFKSWLQIKDCYKILPVTPGYRSISVLRFLCPVLSASQSSTAESRPDLYPLATFSLSHHLLITFVRLGCVMEPFSWELKVEWVQALSSGGRGHIRCPPEVNWVLFSTKPSRWLLF